MDTQSTPAAQPAPRWLLIALSPPACALAGAIWSYVAWSFFPGDSGDPGQLEFWRFWGFDFPLTLFGGALVLAWLASVVALMRRSGFLAVVATAYYAAAFPFVFFGCILFVRMKIFQ